MKSRRSRRTDARSGLRQVELQKLEGDLKQKLLSMQTVSDAQPEGQASPYASYDGGNTVDTTATQEN